MKDLVKRLINGGYDTTDTWNDLSVIAEDFIISRNGEQPSIFIAEASGFENGGASFVVTSKMKHSMKGYHTLYDAVCDAISWTKFSTFIVNIIQIDIKKHIETPIVHDVVYDAMTPIFDNYVVLVLGANVGVTFGPDDFIDCLTNYDETNDYLAHKLGDLLICNGMSADDVKGMLEEGADVEELSNLLVEKAKDNVTSPLSYWVGESISAINKEFLLKSVDVGEVRVKSVMIGYDTITLVTCHGTTNIYNASEDKDTDFGLLVLHK